MADISLEKIKLRSAHRKVDFILIAAGFFGFLFSYVVLSRFYTGGDQTFYTRLYADLPSENLVRGYLVYQKTLSAMEPLYYVLVWTFSRFLEKSIFMSFVNTALITVLLLNVRRVSLRPVAAWIVLTNFYLFVLLFSAERLKFGMLFLGIMLLARGNKRHLFALLALMSHFQIIFLLVVAYVTPSLGQIAHLGDKRNRIKLILLALFAAVVARFFLGYLQGKFTYYYRGFDILSIGKACLMLAVTIQVAKSRGDAVVNQLPLVVVAVLFGTDRILIFMYMVYLWRLFESRREYTISAVFVNGYFFVAGLTFLYRTIAFHNGFAGGLGP